MRNSLPGLIQALVCCYHSNRNHTAECWYHSGLHLGGNVTKKQFSSFHLLLSLSSSTWTKNTASPFELKRYLVVWPAAPGK